MAILGMGQNRKIVNNLDSRLKKLSVPSSKLLKADKTIKEIGYFIKGDASVLFKNCSNEKLSQNKPFSHF